MGTELFARAERLLCKIRDRPRELLEHRLVDTHAEVPMCVPSATAMMDSPSLGKWSIAWYLSAAVRATVVNFLGKCKKGRRYYPLLLDRCAKEKDGLALTFDRGRSINIIVMVCAKGLDRLFCAKKVLFPWEQDNVGRK